MASASIWQSRAGQHTFITIFQTIPEIPAETNGMTAADATTYCRNTISGSATGTACSAVPGVDLDLHVENCMKDIMVGSPNT